MKRTSTIFLLVLFFGGIGLVWFADNSNQLTRVDRIKLSDVVLPELDKVKVQEIRQIEITGGPDPILMQRGEGGSWQLLKPVKTAASRVSAEAMVTGLGLLKRLPMSGTLDGPPESFGLDKPERTIRLFGADSSQPLASLELGKSIKDGRYVRRGSDKAIMIVDSKLVGLADASAKAWRETTLFQGSTFQVEKVKISRPGRPLELEHLSGRWRMILPFRALVEENKAEAIVADLLSMRVPNQSGYVADDVRDFAPYGLDAPALTIEIKTANSPTQTVYIGKPAPRREGAKSEEFYARRGDLNEVILIGNGGFKQLGTDPSTLRSLKLADFAAKRIEFLQITEGGHRSLLQRTKSGWVFKEPTEEPAESADIEKFVEALVESSASQVLEPEKVVEPRLDPPRWAIEAWTSGRDGTQRIGRPETPPDLAIYLGRDDALLKSIFAQIPGDPMILALPDKILDTLPYGHVGFRSRNLLRDDPKKITRLTVRRPDGIFILDAIPGKTSADATKWLMVAPASAPGDPSVIANLVNAMATLRADRLIADRPEDGDREGLNQAVLYVTWRVRTESEGEPVEHRLRVGAPVRGQKDGARYARLDDLPTVFSVSQNFLRLFDQELRDRRPFGQGFKPDRVAKLEFDWPGRDKSLSFVRVPDPLGGPANWKPAGADPGSFPLSRLGPLVAELAGLQTNRYVQYLGEFAPFLGLTPARMTIKITLESPKNEFVLSFGSISPATPDKLAATLERTEDGSVFLLPVEEWGPFIEAPTLPGDLPFPVFSSDPETPSTFKPNAK